mmetsp:Transcript_4377/g.15185  ORF Transcript_4377/g.15185 Transcript_4377/m.15185 type:complete len:246 (-) Transcript_4377:2512-3249(-)
MRRVAFRHHSSRRPREDAHRVLGNVLALGARHILEELFLHLELCLHAQPFDLELLLLLEMFQLRPAALNVVLNLRFELVALVPKLNLLFERLERLHLALSSCRRRNALLEGALSLRRSQLGVRGELRRRRLREPLRSSGQFLIDANTARDCRSEFAHLCNLPRVCLFLDSCAPHLSLPPRSYGCDAHGAGCFRRRCSRRESIRALLSSLFGSLLASSTLRLRSRHQHRRWSFCRAVVPDKACSRK